MRIASLLLISSMLASRLLAFQEADVSETMRVVYHPEDFRFRSDAMAPTLVYKRAFFERFGPSSVGDILKRIPGISGAGDAGEFEQPQMRGLGPQYTLILVNGKRLPGLRNDQTLAVDRIPAHLVERIEVVRSPGSDQEAMGIGGAINIVLKQGASHSDIQLGSAYYQPDEKYRGNSAVSYGYATGNLELGFSGVIQERHNPKVQHALIRDGEGQATLKDETNVQNTLETAFTASLAWRLAGGGSLQAGLTGVASDRTDLEDAVLATDVENEVIFDHGAFKQTNWGLEAAFQKPWGIGNLHMSLAHDRLDVDNHSDIGVLEDQDPVVEEVETNDTVDRETQFSASFAMNRQGGHTLKFGLDAGVKIRKARARLFELDDEAYEEVPFGGQFRIDQRRLDLYLMDTWEVSEAHHVQAGLRMEWTDLDMVDAGISRQHKHLHPAVHYLYRASPANRWRVSLAETVKRPDFMDLQPFVQRDQPYDGQTTRGNPNLKPEYATGLDIGFERRFLNQEGMLGLNLFYRDIRNRVEVVQVAQDQFHVENVGSGEAYGFELDFGAPLARLKMPNVSLFANLSLLDSRLTDQGTGETRSFNLQPEYVSNIGILHVIPSWHVSYGMNWLSQGRAGEDLLTEQAGIEQGDNLEMVFDWKIGRFMLRLVARNLLDSSTRVRLETYEGLVDPENFDSLFLEEEKAGRSFLLNFHFSF